MNYGKLNIIGIGPGGDEHISFYAKDTIINSDVIVGYKKYIELIEHLIKGKEVYSTGMMGEIKRCEAAIEYVLDGKDTSVVCSGDCGIYGLAGLILEILDKKGLINQIKVEIIPGIPAFVACAASLGAPLMHDFACISLSDLMTSWDVIEKRIHLCGEGDFVTVIYNPKSKKRNWQIIEAINILRKFRDEKTPVGIVKNATRDGEKIIITNLRDIDFDEIDMFTLIIVGNSKTKNIGRFMVTPRGYLEKYKV